MAGMYVKLLFSLGIVDSYQIVKHNCTCADFIAEIQNATTEDECGTECKQREECLSFALWSSGLCSLFSGNCLDCTASTAENRIFRVNESMPATGKEAASIGFGQDATGTFSETPTAVTHEHEATTNRTFSETPRDAAVANSTSSENPRDAVVTHEHETTRDTAITHEHEATTNSTFSETPRDAAVTNSTSPETPIDAVVTHEHETTRDTANTHEHEATINSTFSETPSSTHSASPHPPAKAGELCVLSSTLFPHTTGVCQTRDRTAPMQVLYLASADECAAACLTFGSYFGCMGFTFSSDWGKCFLMTSNLLLDDASYTALCTGSKSFNHCTNLMAPIASKTESHVEWPETVGHMETRFLSCDPVNDNQLASFEGQPWLSLTQCEELCLHYEHCVGAIYDDNKCVLFSEFTWEGCEELTQGGRKVSLRHCGTGRGPCVCGENFCDASTTCDHQRCKTVEPISVAPPNEFVAGSSSAGLILFATLIVCTVVLYAKRKRYNRRFAHVEFSDIHADEDLEI